MQQPDHGGDTTERRGPLYRCAQIPRRFGSTGATGAPIPDEGGRLARPSLRRHDAGKPMKRAAEKVAAIRRKLPRGLKLPAEFAALVELVTHPKEVGRDLMNVTWSDPCWLLNTGKAALKSFVPFLRLSDGGIAAFWVDGADLRVARCNSEGDYGVIARDFQDFVARLVNPGAELLEQLELREPLDTRALARGQKPRPVPAAMNEAFSRWVESHSLDAKTTQTPAPEVIRKTLQAIARRTSTMASGTRCRQSTAWRRSCPACCPR